MRIVILCQWYPPEPWGLFAELAEGLAEHGHEVTVLTGFPNYPTGVVYPDYRMQLGFRERMKGIEVVRVPLYANHGRSGPKRALNFVSFAFSALFFAPFRLKRPDLVYAIQPPTAGLAAAGLAILWRVPFVYEIQDMWPETLPATGMMSNKLLLRCVGAICDIVHGRAKRIRVISPGFKRNLIEKGVKAERIETISNWVDTDLYCPSTPDEEMAERLGTKGKFTVLYAGNIGLAQGLEVLVEAAYLVRDLDKVQFVVVGDGVDLPRLEALAQRRGISNIRFMGRFPAESMNRVYSVADALLIHLKDDPLFRITIPHKTLTYLAVGKPILAAVEGDVAELVNKARAGLVCPSEDPAALAQIVRKLFGMQAFEREGIGHSARAEAEAKYSKKILIQEVCRLLEATG